VSDVDDATAAAIYHAWEHNDATFDDLAREYGVDRTTIRRTIFAMRLEREERDAGEREVALASPVGGAAADDVAVGEIVAAGAEYLPVHYRGEGPPPGASQDIIDNWLPDSARRLILRGKSPHTVKAYMQAMGWWVKFAKAHGLTVMPAPQNGVIRLLDWWETFPVHVGCSGAKQKNGEPCTGHRPSPSAVWLLYSGLKWFHGLGEPPTPWQCGVKLTDAIAGYTKQIKDDGWRRTSAPRAYPADIRAMLDALEAMPDEPPPGFYNAGGLGSKQNDDPKNDDVPVWFSRPRRDFLRALILAAFYTGGRASDLARYRVTDVSRFPLGLQLTVARSKGSKGSKDEEFRTIFTDVDNPAYCGVLALERWIARLDAEAITEGALFRPVHKGGTIVRGAPDKLSYRMDVTGLSRQVRMVAKAAWQRSGKTLLLDWRTFSVHSLRRGRVQLLLESGADVWDVETELGWAHGGAIKFYRAEIARQDASAANALGML
jgi:integrase